MSRVTVRRYLTAIFWAAAGSMHFLRRGFYEDIVPPPLRRRKREIVIVSGIAELLGGLAILPDATRRFARSWLLVTLAAVYPANLYMALAPERFRAIPKWLLWARLPLQGAFAWLTWRGTE
jgi:uncharacterized membrane protein